GAAPRRRARRRRVRGLRSGDAALRRPRVPVRRARTHVRRPTGRAGQPDTRRRRRHADAHEARPVLAGLPSGPMTTDAIESRIANALFDVQPARVSWIARPSIALVRAMYKGLWVGGRATIT